MSGEKTSSESKNPKGQEPKKAQNARGPSQNPAFNRGPAEGGPDQGLKNGDKQAR